MTWGEFKRTVEALDLRDTDEIEFIDVTLLGVRADEHTLVVKPCDPDLLADPEVANELPPGRRYRYVVD